MFAYLRRFAGCTAYACSCVLSLLILQIGAIPAIAETPGPHQDKTWRAWKQLGGYAFDRARGEGELWVPLFQDDDLVLFADIKGKLFETNAREGNFALGLRTKAGNHWALGIWAGYDMRRSVSKQFFHQVAGGFEALSQDVDVRANWYVPVNRSETILRELTASSATTTTSTADIDGLGVSVFNTSTTVVTNSGTVIKEHALFGVDGEVGIRVPLESMFGGDDTSAFWRGTELRIYAGGYYFDSPDVEDAVAGPRVRLEWRIKDAVPFVPGSLLSFEAAFQYDEPRQDQYEVGLRLRLPFGHGRIGDPHDHRLTDLERRMSDAIQRDTDVVANIKSENFSASSSSSNHSRERAVDVATGVRLDRVVRVDASGNLNDTLAAAGGNSLIIASGNRGAFVNQNVTMQADQTLMGGGAAITVRGSRSGRTATFRSGGQSTTIQQTTNDAAITVNSNTHITGIDIVGGGDGAGRNNRGITTAGQRFENIRIDHVSIRNTDSHGIRFDSVINDWSVRHVSITGVTNGNGIDIEDRNQNFEISNVTFSDISLRSGDAIHISSSNTGVISDNSFNDGIAEFLIRVKSDNVITGSGNVNNGGNEIFQYFGGNNQLDIGFETIGFETIGFETIGFEPG